MEKMYNLNNCYLNLKKSKQGKSQIKHSDDDHRFVLKQRHETLSDWMSKKTIESERVPKPRAKSQYCTISKIQKQPTASFYDSYKQAFLKFKLKPRINNSNQPPQLASSAFSKINDSAYISKSIDYADLQTKSTKSNKKRTPIITRNNPQFQSIFERMKKVLEQKKKKEKQLLQQIAMLQSEIVNLKQWQY
ncbi:unnamed protein product [Paramecium octaurelia]|uniref:Uncharacterized protein n=1 Tax=Paramecium octaurelia TaxID=43137 RepID=A0A8S1V5E9_PAROT|nr:unnamed protein product [Paramecium octaurelia]